MKDKSKHIKWLKIILEGMKISLAQHRKDNTDKELIEMYEKWTAEYEDELDYYESDIYYLLEFPYNERHKINQITKPC